MTALSVGLSVTTPDIEDIDGPFSLADGNAEVVEYDPGGMVKRRQVLRSPSVRGGRQTGSVPDLRQLRLKLRIFGTNKGNLDDNVGLWVAVFDQHRYQTTVTLNGIDTTWKCEDADWHLANDTTEGVDPHRLRMTPMRQVLEFLIPTDPDPLAGVL